MGIRKTPRRHLSAYAFILTGILLGYFIAAHLRTLLAPCSIICCSSQRKQWDVKQDVIVNSSQTKVLFGILTAAKYIEKRALAVSNTWAYDIGTNGDILYFSSANSSSTSIPIVSLPGVDDKYPPQKKSFLMLKFLHDHYLDQYEWFVRCDDDVYIKTDRLFSFLHNINSSKNLYIGQAGQGTRSEFGKLSLDDDENFCMGGPGVVLSRSALRSLIPHINYCLNNLLLTNHEDVEIGRCIRKFVKIQCTWNFEMQQLFYQNYDEDGGSFLRSSLNSQDYLQAITLHPVKDYRHQYRLHAFFTEQRIREQQKILKFLERNIQTTDNLLRLRNNNERSDVEDFQNYLLDTNYEGLSSLAKRSNRPASITRSQGRSSGEGVIHWEFLTKALFSTSDVNPKRTIPLPQKNAIHENVRQLMAQINEKSKQKGRNVLYRDLYYGYYKINPLHGADYVLDLLLTYRRHTGRKLTIPVRRHAYMQQSFSNIHCRIIDFSSFGSPVAARKDFIKSPENINLENFLQSDSEDPLLELDTEQKHAVNFILPLSNRLQAFERFINNFELLLLDGENVSLLVVLFHSVSKSLSEEGRPRQSDMLSVRKSITDLQTRYPHYKIQLQILEKPFSRGVALHSGSELFGNRSLLVFIDVDMQFQADVLHRIRLNVMYGKQVYFPIVFSQYNPNVVCGNASCLSNENVFDPSPSQGYWRQYGYGIAAMFKGDLRRVGGFDTTIKGWGKEDVDLYEKFLAANYSTFRAIDPGLVHIYHDVTCDSSLPEKQYKMCVGSLASNYGPSFRLIRGALRRRHHRLP